VVGPRDKVAFAVGLYVLGAGDAVGAGDTVGIFEGA